MPLRYLLRDGIRTARAYWDHARNGGRITMDGEDFDIPAFIGPGLRYFLRAGTYEGTERAMVAAHLPPDLPVIELGGSLGIVSRFIGRRIGNQRHLIVEAHPSLARVCGAVASGTSGRTPEVIHAAVAYGSGPVVRFKASSGYLDSKLGQPGKGGTIAVPSVTLRALRDRLGADAIYSVVMDIEGAEFDLFAQGPAEFEGCRIVIMEIHRSAFKARGSSEEAFLDSVAQCGFTLVEQKGNVIVASRAG